MSVLENKEDGMVLDAMQAESVLLRQSVEAQKATIASLREQLRLANDKMAEMVRQARWDVCVEALSAQNVNAIASRLRAIRDANAPKD